MTALPREEAMADATDRRQERGGDHLAERLEGVKAAAPRVSRRQDLEEVPHLAARGKPVGACAMAMRPRASSFCFSASSRSRRPMARRNALASSAQRVSAGGGQRCGERGEVDMRGEVGVAGGRQNVCY